MFQKYVCPECREKTGVNIIYGFPLIPLGKLEEQGLIALGGCIVQEDSPDRRCTACNAEWRIKRRNKKAMAT